MEKRINICLKMLVINNGLFASASKRFEDMNMMRHEKTLGIVEVDLSAWKNLSNGEKKFMLFICDKKLCEYYDRIK